MRTLASRTAIGTCPDWTAAATASGLRPRAGGISRSSPASSAGTRWYTAPQSETTRPSKPHSSRRTVVSSHGFSEADNPLILL